MIRYERSKSSMFLLEILINILLFSFLCVCSLQFFIKSYQLTENTTILHHAVTACNNVAAVYEAGDGSLTSITENFPNVISENGQSFIYLDENYQECDSQNVIYYITIEEMNSDIPSIHISFYKNGEDASYSIDAYCYQPLTPATVDAVDGSSADALEEEEVSNYE